MSTPAAGVIEEPGCRVNNSVCLRGEASEDQSDWNWMMSPPFTWPWAENPDDFFVIAETTAEKNKPRNRVWSRIMMEKHGLLTQLQSSGKGYQMTWANPKKLDCCPLLTIFENPNDKPDFEHTGLGALLKEVLTIESIDAINLWKLLEKRASEKEEITEGKYTKKEELVGKTQSPEEGQETFIDGTSSYDTQNRNQPDVKGKHPSSSEETHKILEKLYTVCGCRWNEQEIPVGPNPAESQYAGWPVFNRCPEGEEGKYVQVRFLSGEIEGFTPIKYIYDNVDEVAVQTLRPKLNALLPPDLLPDELEILDPKGALGEIDSHKTDTKPLVYRRRWPPVGQPQPAPVGKLKRTTLQIGKILGSGSHAQVLRGMMTLPEPLETLTGATSASLAIKIANNNDRDRVHLRREAYAYNLFSTPQCNYIQKDWSGHVACDG